MIGPQYVYAVVPATSAARPGGMTGVEQGPVASVSAGPLAALTTTVRTEKVRPTRANLTAHQSVVAAAHQSGAVLPVRFGTVLPDVTAVVEELLEPNATRFEELLGELDGKDEFRVKARYLPDVALREVVQRSPAVQRLKARTAAGRAGPGLQMQLGELVMGELERLREEDAANVLDALLPHALLCERLDERTEDVAVHAALLVSRPEAAALDAALEALAEKQRGRLRVELIGPLPAWDFSQAWDGAA